MTLLWSMLVLFAFTPLWLFSILIALPVGGINLVHT